MGRETSGWRFASNEQSGISNFTAERYFEKRPFQNEGVRRFYAEWFTLNSDMSPVYVDDEAYLELEDIIEPHSDGTTKVYIRKNAPYYELLETIELLDEYAYQEPDSKSYTEKRDKIHQLGKELLHDGIYLLALFKEEKPTDSVSGKGEEQIEKERAEYERIREQALQIGLDFYVYGAKYAEIDDKEFLDIVEQIVNSDAMQGRSEIIQLLLDKHPLDEAENERIERWFLGDEVYENRKKRVEASFEKRGISEDDPRFQPLLRENRQQLAAHFIKALNTRSQFKTKVEQNLEQTVKEPLYELDTSIVEQSFQFIEKIEQADQRDLLKQLLGYLKLDYTYTTEKLRDVLQVDALKAELMELRKTGDKEAIAQKEEEICAIVCQEVSKYVYSSKDTVMPLLATIPYMIVLNNVNLPDTVEKATALAFYAGVIASGVRPIRQSFPKYLEQKKDFICAGYSAVAGYFLEQVGIDTFSGIQKGHIFLINRLSNGKVLKTDPTAGAPLQSLPRRKPVEVLFADDTKKQEFLDTLSKVKSGQRYGSFLEGKDYTLAEKSVMRDVRRLREETTPLTKIVDASIQSLETIGGLAHRGVKVFKGEKSKAKAEPDVAALNYKDGLKYSLFTNMGNNASKFAWYALSKRQGSPEIQMAIEYFERLKRENTKAKELAIRPFSIKYDFWLSILYHKAGEREKAKLYFQKFEKVASKVAAKQIKFWKPEWWDFL